jgi:nucleotide-binding universal stress UspA family protein
LPRFYLGPEIDVSPPVLEEIEGAAGSYLARVASRLEGDGITALYQILEGEPSRALVDYADNKAGSLLALTTHGRAGLTRWMVGSVADKVVRSALSPVLIARPAHIAS